jgi:ATP-dependent DNA helicase DinG
VLGALRRLDRTASPPLPVADPALRGLRGAVAGSSMAAAVPEQTDERPVAQPPPPPDSARTAVTHGHAWSAQEDEELRDGIELGLTAQELAESMELPLAAVLTRLDGLGLDAATTPTLGFD